MTTAVTNNTNTSSTSTDTSTTAQKSLNTNYADFLKLLTTELQNQDPTTPMDPTAMVGQLAALSQVEQQIATNTALSGISDNIKSMTDSQTANTTAIQNLLTQGTSSTSILQQLSSLFSSTQTNTAVSYIGKQVDATGNKLSLITGKDTDGNTVHQGALVYNLPAGASKATITITDNAGKTLFTGPGTTIAGRNEMFWDGTNNGSGGGTMADGVYNFKVTATDSSGAALTTTTYTTGTVTAVDTQDGTNTLSLGSISVPLSNIHQIYNPGTNPGV